ncbi:hypothetical protein KA082_03045 [Candidatus Woesebacteria bacterium]|nr:hypothetical protein [Candidatus Woesebacteria bacterium]
MSAHYIFQFGNTPALSLFELRCIAPELVIEELDAMFSRTVADEATFQPQELAERLGGTVKIFKQISVFDIGTSVEALTAEVLANLRSDFEMKAFAIAELGRDHLPAIDPAELKAQLKRENINTRYIEGSRHGLSSAVLSHKKVKELALIQTEKEIVLAQTVAVQDIDAWTLRDRGKPYADRKKGMLPPKLARMMLNIAVGTDQAADGYVLDPFCGTGTVLIEALTLGFPVVGSDLEAEASAGTRENLDWYKQYMGISTPSIVLHQDATKITPPSVAKVQYLVTEPFLGKQKPKPDQVENIFRGLHKLYLGAFKHWRTFLQPGAKIVCIFPAILPEHTPGYKEATLKQLIDKLAEIGYTTCSESLVYHRPQAVISRQIYKFEYLKK